MLVVSAVVLAAGAASRYGSPKQLLLLPAVLERLERSAVDRVVVVAGAYSIAPGPHLSRIEVTVVDCADWARGPGASLRCGLAALDGAVAAALVVLADGPFLDPRAVARVIAADDGASLLAASYGGERGHPVLIPRALWQEIPDEGARALEARLVPCDDLTPPGDVDTPPEATTV